MSALWSDAAFRERVVHRCDELRKSQGQVLKEAGLTHDYLTNEPAHGRRIDRLARLCTPLQWSLAELLGLNAKVNPKLMLIALCTAQKVTANGHPLKDDTLVSNQTTIYNLLIERHAVGRAADDEGFLTSVAQVLAEHEACQLGLDPNRVD
jgi:hypothetical protein